jgi:hypothetical protein
MVKRIVAFALHQPLFLLLLVALFIAGGIVAFNTLPINWLRVLLGGVTS